MIDVNDLLASTALDPRQMPLTESVFYEHLRRTYGMDFIGWTVGEFLDMTNNRAETSHAAEVQTALTRLRVQDEAKRLFSAEKAGGTDLPEPMNLQEFLSRDIAGVKYVIDDVLVTGGNVVFAAQRKAGKTTVVVNLCRSLIDGDPFLDTFEVTTRRRVALVDTELSPGLLQEWLGSQNIGAKENLGVFPIKGNAASFNILDDKIRSRWADMLRGYDVLILDPLRPVIDSLGLNEWNEMGPLLQAFDALKAEAGISEGIIVQHHGHHSERAAGDSRLEGWPEANWNLTRDDPKDPRSVRYFDAYGRDVDVDKGVLTLGPGKRLGYDPDTIGAKSDRLVQEVVSLIEEHGEMKTGDIAGAGIRGVTSKTAAGILAEAVYAGKLVFRVGEKNAKYYRLP